MEISNQQAQDIITAYYKLYLKKPTSYQEVVEIHKIREANLAKLKEDEVELNPN